MQGPSAEQLFAGETAEASSDGPDEESTSEAMNSWAGMYLWGVAMNKTEFIDMGAIGYALEAEAVKEYWYDAEQTNYDPGYTRTMVSRVFGNKVDSYTWFSAEMQHAWGIQYITTGPHMTYQGYFRPYRVIDYGYFKTNGGAVSDGWKDIHWMYRCFFEPALVISEHTTNAVTDSGNTRANLFYWVPRDQHARRAEHEFRQRSPRPGRVQQQRHGHVRRLQFHRRPRHRKIIQRRQRRRGGILVITNLRTSSVRSSDDADGDGLSNGIELGILSNLYRPDTDGDGFTDWAEWFTGTKAYDAASLFQSLGFDGAALSWPGTTGRTYRVRAYATASDAAAKINASNVLTVAGTTGTMNQAVSLPPWTNAIITVTAE